MTNPYRETASLITTYPWKDNAASFEAYVEQLLRTTFGESEAVEVLKWLAAPHRPEDFLGQEADRMIDKANAYLAKHNLDSPIRMEDAAAITRDKIAGSTPAESTSLPETAINSGSNAERREMDVSLLRCEASQSPVAAPPAPEKKEERVQCLNPECYYGKNAADVRKRTIWNQNGLGDMPEIGDCPTCHGSGTVTKGASV